MKPSFSYIIECPDCGCEQGLPVKDYDYSPVVRCNWCSLVYDATAHRVKKVQDRPTPHKPKGIYGDH